MILQLLVTAGLLCQPPGPNALTGFWESAETSTGGIGHAIEFREDGRYVDAVTVMVSFVWRMEGDRLVVAADAAALEKTNPARAPVAKFEQHQLVLADPEGAALAEKQRIGLPAAGRPELLGAWRYRHRTGATAFERYLSDGQGLFRLPMKSSAACYAVVSRDRVNLLRAEQGREQMRYEVRGDALILLAPSGQAYPYRRVEGGAWYDHENIDYLAPPPP